VPASNRVETYCLPTPLTGRGRYISRGMSQSFAYNEVEITLLNKDLVAPCVHVSRSLAPRRELYRATSLPDRCLLPHLPFRAAYSFRWPLQLTSTASFLASQREHKCDPGHLVVHNLWGKNSKCLSTDMINAFLVLVSPVIGLIAYVHHNIGLVRAPCAHPTSSFSLLRILWMRYRGSEQEVAAVRAAHHRHGPIVRLGPREISVASSNIEVRRELSRGALWKSGWYSPFSNQGLVRHSAYDSY
jgi:hypothetical protein